MEARRVDDPRAFVAAASPLLLADEARHSLIFGLATTLRDHPPRYADHGLWLAEDEGDVVGAALRTPPHRLVLARPRTPPALQALAAAIDDDIPGVVGAIPEVEEFAQAWWAKTGRRPRLSRAQGIYAIERVNPVVGVPGRMAAAGPGDREVARDWYRAFAVEAHVDEVTDEEALARTVDHRLSAEGHGIVLWRDEGPVSLAAFGSPTPNGIRIGPVYTPPERRRHGYASALVAELSSRLLESRRFCFLYTDLANPTSNKIYEQIGYERVCESAELEFSPRA